MPTSSSGAYASRYGGTVRTRRSDNTTGHSSRYDKKLSIDHLPTSSSSRKPTTLSSSHHHSSPTNSNTYISQYSHKDVNSIADKLQASDFSNTKPYGSSNSGNHYSTSSSAYGSSYSLSPYQRSIALRHSSGLNGGHSQSSSSSRSSRTDSPLAPVHSTNTLQGHSLGTLRNNNCASPGSDADQVSPRSRHQLRVNHLLS